MPRSHFNRCSGKQIFLGSWAEETRSPDTGTRRRGAVTSISRNTIQKFEYLLVGELALDHLTLSNRSADYINSFASIHVGIGMASSAWLPLTYRQTVNDYRKIQMPKCGPSDDRQEICRTMINSFSTGFSMTVSTKDIGHRRIKKLYLGPPDTK